MQEFDMFGVNISAQHASALAKTWDYPPFSVLSARDGWWQERKRAWLALGIESELGRSAELIPNGGGNGSKARYDNQPPPPGPTGKLMGATFSNAHALQTWQRQKAAQCPPATIATASAATAEEGQSND